jgi:sulfur relay (sulfurtransferase) DsrC/TusE family protein
MARSVVGKVQSISWSNPNTTGVLDFVVSYYADVKNCPPIGQIVAKCDITQNDTQLNQAIRQAAADAVNASAVNGVSPGLVANDVVGCNV